MSDEAGQGSDVAWSRLAAALRENPLPLALVGFGLAWMLARSACVGDTRAAADRLRAAGERIGEAVASKPGDALAAAESEAGGWVHQAADAARGALRTVQASAAVERAEQFAGEAGQRAAQFGDRLADAIERHPLIVGALGLVSGAALASLLPGGKSTH
jgi:hypothetical protein